MRADSRLVGTEHEAASRSGGLSSADLDDLVAFGEVVVEGRALSVQDRRYLREHMEDRVTRSRESLAQYRTTARTLERLAGRRFSRLEPGERIALVARHRLGVSSVWPDEDVGPFPNEMRTVRARVVPDLVEGYYRSPAGWAVVGYDTYPGRCGELTRYTRREV
jgi:hypothetical protein